MYAIIKTGGKQYKVEPGTVISVEKLDAEVGEEVELPVIFIADGDSIEADPEKAAATKVVAEVIEQYKGQKQLVFKFKKRKGYKKLQGHRQQLTKLRVIAVGAEKAEKAEKVAVIAPEPEEAVEEVAEEAAAEVVEETVEAVAEEAVEEVVEEAAEEAVEAAEEAAEAAEAVEAVEEAVEEAADAE